MTDVGTLATIASLTAGLGIAMLAAVALFLFVLLRYRWPEAL